MGRKKPSVREDESGATIGKSKKKAFSIGDDEYSVGTGLSEEVPVQEERVAPVGNKKKGKKGNTMKTELKDNDEEVDIKVDEEDEDDAPVSNFSGKKKTKGKTTGNNSVFSASSFGLLGEEGEEGGEEEEDEEEDEALVAFTGKKKPSKSKKASGKSGFSSSVFAALSDEDGEELDMDNDEDMIAFSGKKKPSKGKKSGGSVSFDVLEEENDGKDNNEDEDSFGISFTGKKKKSSKGSKKAPENKTSVAVLDEENDLVQGGDNDDQVEDVSSIKFSGKKKPSKKKNTIENGNADASSQLVEPDQPNVKADNDSENKKQMIENVAEPSKNKKKKKKGGKTGQEEEGDLDKILAELGAAPVVPPSVAVVPPSAAVVPPPVQNQAEPQVAAIDQEAEEEGPTAASKKKKKKKDKKAAAATPSVDENQEETKTETKTKVPDKKVPKHVREMQERLAKLKEAEERKKREEEEKLRKEEEERLRQEELERAAEEKKRLKKEKEKEKVNKKKLEGTYLTAKQKEENRRIAAMRNQILANAGGVQLPGDTTDAPAKKPLYQKKKSKKQAPSSGVIDTTDSKEVEEEIVLEINQKEVENVEDKTEVINEVGENGIEEEEEEEDDGNWDEKDVDAFEILPEKSAFADEESEPKPEPLVVKKEIKKVEVEQLPSVAAKPVGGSVEKIEAKKKDSEPGNADKNIKKVAVNTDKRTKKEETKKSDDSNEQSLRSPICCIMGHVDTGKTKLLDCIRGTNVQEGEAGGITQQIGATYFPAENIRDRTKELKHDAKLNVPGLLVIDTPGHESFTNLRSRGSGLCDIAILVVDIMHGLEPQTIESLNLLKMRNTEFIIALNKVDRLYGWKAQKNAPITKTMKLQTKDVEREFNMRVTQVVTQFKEQGLNTELYYKNKEMGETYSIVPTSAISGEGIPDLLLLLVQWAQKTMVKRLTYSNEIQCTVLEVKVVEGHGTTIDVVLVNGVLHEGDQIVVCGLQGPIVASIRALLTPHPMKELRVKGTYLHHKEIKAAQGIKITAQGLEHAIAGTSLYVVGPNDDVEDIKESCMEDMKSVMSRIDKSGEGVYVQASTLGSLEALLEFLKTPAVNIPVSGISIGPVHKKDVMRASVMLEKKKEYGTILAFDVKVTQEAREMADELGVKIFLADIIYHLFDQFKAYIDSIKEEKKKEASEDAVFPCVLKIMPNCVFNKKDPIVLGVDILEGVAKIGTPICVPQREFIDIGRIASIENNHKPVDSAKKGQKVAIKIIGSNSDEQQKMCGRHFEEEDELVSKISRSSLDALKEFYSDELKTEEKRLLFKLKKLFKIP